MFSTYPTVVWATSETGVFGAKTFTLDNGLQVVVVENNRAPIVTHMLWIKAGAADEPESVGGVAHFLEHLMFKGTPNYPAGVYSRTVRALGGQENAFTSQDYTAYFFTLAPEHLERLMAMERDRFLHLAPTPDSIQSEHAVIIEERRQRTENDDLGPLYEQINALTFTSTSYADPVIGWMHDMEKLTWKDAQNFRKKWYLASNMVLILSGDINLERARQLAQKYYHDLPTGPVPERRRLSPPLHPAPINLHFKSDRVKQPQAIFVWRVPSFHQDSKTALTLQVMTEVLDGGASTPLYQNMVVQNGVATGINLSYDSDAWGESSLWFTATPATGITPTSLAEKMQIAFKTATNTMTQADVNAAIVRLKRQAIFARDSITAPAQIIGTALTTGSSLTQIETWPQEIETVTVTDIRKVLDQLITCRPAPGICQPPLTALVEAASDSGATPPSSGQVVPYSPPTAVSH